MYHYIIQTVETLYTFLYISMRLRKFIKWFCQINQAMVKKVSLNIPDDSYKELASLSDFYKQDIKNTITGILDVMGHRCQSIINLSKEYKVPVKPSTVMFHVIEVGLHSVYVLFNKVLENLGVKGLYTLGDFDVDLDENHMWFSYDALVGCNLQIDGFYVDIGPGLKTLTTTSYIEVKKVDDKVLGKLKKLVQSVEVPEEFGELEDYNIEVEEEEFWTLRIDCTAESLGYLPSVKRISEFVEQVFKKAGIE